MCTAFEDYVPSFDQLCANYVNRFFHFVLLIFGILEKSTYKLIHMRKSGHSAKINKNQYARITSLSGDLY